MICIKTINKYFSLSRPIPGCCRISIPGLCIKVSGNKPFRNFINTMKIKICDVSMSVLLFSTQANFINANIDMSIKTKYIAITRVIFRSANLATYVDKESIFLLSLVLCTLTISLLVLQNDIFTRVKLYVAPAPFMKSLEVSPYTICRFNESLQFTRVYFLFRSLDK